MSNPTCVKLKSIGPIVVEHEAIAFETGDRILRENLTIMPKFTVTEDEVDWLVIKNGFVS